MAQKKKTPFVRMPWRGSRQPENADDQKKEPETADPDYKKMLEDAPDTKVLFAVKTKGYYRFASEYPSSADAGGYRVNGVREKKPWSTAAAVLLAVGIVLCFCAGYIGTHTALSVSDLPPETTAETTVQPSQPESLPASEPPQAENGILG